MKESKAQKKRSQISPPENFTHLTHIDRSDTVNDLVHALQTPVRPLDGGWPEVVPLPRKATGASGAACGGTLGRGNGLTPYSSSSQSTSNLHSGTVSSAGYSTWNSGVKGKIKRSVLPFSNDFLVPKSRAPDVPSPSSPSDSRFLAPTPAGGRHYRSVSASNEDASLHTMGYVNVKPFVQPYYDPHSRYTHAENDGYVSPYSILQPTPAPPPHQPSSSKGRASTVHAEVHVKDAVRIRPPREVAPPPPRDSRHETDANTQIAAPDRITITLARPTDLFGPGPGLGSGPGFGLGLGTIGIGIDDIVPLPCPGSLDSGVSEPPFAAPAPPPTEAAASNSSFSPEDIKEYIGKIQSFYHDFKESEHLDSEGIIHRINLLKPASEILLADMEKMEASKKKRPAPGPPTADVNCNSSSDATPTPDEAVTPTGRPVPKPRTTKPPGQTSPVGDTTPTPPVAALAARFNALPEAGVQLAPAPLKLAPLPPQLPKVLPPDSDDDEEMTRL